MVGNSTLDFNYYGPVEEYATYVKSRPACYIDEDNPGMTSSDAATSVSNRSLVAAFLPAPGVSGNA